MAVSAFPRSRAATAPRQASVPLVILALSLVPPAVDLLARVQPGLSLTLAAAIFAAAATGLLLVTWARYPRTGWLAAAALASSASLAMRLIGADVAPALSLLCVIALGIGGAFASPRREAELSALG